MWEVPEGLLRIVHFFYQSIDIDPNSSMHANGINVICSIILTEMSPVVWKAQEVENWNLNPFLFE